MNINNKFSTNSENYTKLHYNILSINKYDGVRVNDTMKIIYSYMHSFYQQTNEPVYTSALFISELMGYNNRTTVQDNIKKLIQCGLLTVVSDKKGQSKHFIVNDIDSDKVINGNGEMIKKGTNKDGKRPVKPRKEKLVVKEEIKQNPMPTLEPVAVPPVVNVFEKPNDSTFEEDMAATELLVKPESVPCGVREVSMEDFIDGNVDLSYSDFLKHYAKIGLDENKLTDKARELYREHIREESEDIPF